MHLLDLTDLIEMEISILISNLTWILWKAERAFSIRHIAKCLKSGISIYNSEVPDTVGRKTTRKRTKTIAKCFTSYAKAIILPNHVCMG